MTCAFHPPQLAKSGYHEGRRFTVCCPLCLRLFEQARDRFARGDRPLTLLQQLLDEIKWRDSGN